jgi:hypothetical protein
MGDLMKAVRNAGFLAEGLIMLSSLLPGSAAAQSALDVVNITPHPHTGLAGAGSQAPLLRKSVDLVLLPVSVKEADVMIYAIGTFDRNVPTQEELLGPSMLADIAEVTGGRAFVLDNPNEMPAVAHRIGTELRTQYVLGYQPDEIPHDGRWHKISVKLILPKHLPFFRVHARTGYYAANDASLDHKPAQ